MRIRYPAVVVLGAALLAMATPGLSAAAVPAAAGNPTAGYDCSDGAVTQPAPLVFGPKKSRHAIGGTVLYCSDEETSRKQQKDGTMVLPNGTKRPPQPPADEDGPGLRLNEDTFIPIPLRVPERNGSLNASLRGS